MAKLIIVAVIIVGALNMIKDSGYSLDNVNPREVRMIKGV